MAHLAPPDLPAWERSVLRIKGRAKKVGYNWKRTPPFSPVPMGPKLRRKEKGQLEEAIVEENLNVHLWRERGVAPEPKRAKVSSHEKDTFTLVRRAFFRRISDPSFFFLFSPWCQSRSSGWREEPHSHQYSNLGNNPLAPIKRNI